MDLLGVAGRRHSLPIALCCSSRDELDAVCSTVSNLSYISLASLVFASLCSSFTILTKRDGLYMNNNLKWLGGLVIIHEGEPLLTIPASLVVQVGEIRWVGLGGGNLLVVL